MGKGNALTVSDVDAVGRNVRVTLAVKHGKLRLGSTRGVRVTGNTTGTVRITGTPAAISLALNGLLYQPNASYIGPDTLTITTNDLGNTGSAGPLTDVDWVAITVRRRQ